MFDWGSGLIFLRIFFRRRGAEAVKSGEAAYICRTGGRKMQEKPRNRDTKDIQSR